MSPSQPSPGETSPAAADTRRVTGDGRRARRGRWPYSLLARDGGLTRNEHRGRAYDDRAMAAPDYAHNSDAELLERYRAALEDLRKSVDHEERRRIWQTEARPLADELERRYPPVSEPR
jgi:hypothetical protein